MEKFFSLLNKPLVFPTKITLEITDCCNAKCHYCNMWQLKKKKDELTLAQKKKLIKELKSWLGVFKINFTGGEPFLDQHLIELISYSHRLGVIISATTNGLLVEEKMTHQLVRSGLEEIYLALNGSREETHDETVGVKGSYRKVMRVIDNLKYYQRKEKKKGPFIYINCLVMKKNLAELDKLVYLVKQKKIKGINFIPVWIKKKEERRLLWPQNIRLLNKKIDKLIELKQEGYPIVNSINDFLKMKKYFGQRKLQSNGVSRRERLFFFRNFSVDAIGDVRFDFRWSVIGNVVRMKPKKIWQSQEAQRQRREFLNDFIIRKS
ncbi:MAG: radical SAM protein [Candidatus Marinimicrobia bacterium]|nr:radical SAM protein [Candidatus Neomarinimicrobiota bacterium]